MRRYFFHFLFILRNLLGSSGNFIWYLKWQGFKVYSNTKFDRGSWAQRFLENSARLRAKDESWESPYNALITYLIENFGSGAWFWARAPKNSSPGHHRAVPVEILLQTVHRPMSAQQEGYSSLYENNEIQKIKMTDKFLLAELHSSVKEMKAWFVVWWLLVVGRRWDFCLLK